MRIEIVTTDDSLASDIMGGYDDTISIPGGATLSYRGTTIHESLKFPETLTFILENVVGPIASGLVGNWIYEKIKGRAKTARIERREVRVVREEIIRVIEETTVREE
ncbi:MAG: hypothetical protein ACRDIV_18930 [Ktedonobacteraceae bacterium]